MTDTRTVTYNLKRFVTGESWSMTITLSDENDEPKDLTGYTAKMQMRDRPGGTLYAELSTENGAITINGSLGQIILTQTGTQTAVYAFKKAVYDLYVKSSGGTTTHYLIRGEVAVDQRVTI